MVYFAYTYVCKKFSKFIGKCTNNLYLLSFFILSNRDVKEKKFEYS